MLPNDEQLTGEVAMCNWWICEDCESDFERPLGDIGETELFCPESGSTEVVCEEDKDNEA